MQKNRRIDALCGEFESSWDTDERMPIETVIERADPAERPPLLAELIALEFELRTAAGEPVLLAEYPQRFPDDEQAVAAAIVKISSANAFQPVVSPRQRFESKLETGRLLLGDKLGAGGMGVVFRGQDPQLDRPLAVKILSEDLQSRHQAVARFVREARICARLEHPGIIPIHDMGWLEDRPYFTMKLVVGQSLAELLASREDGDVGLPRLLEVFERVGETLAYAHAQGVVHRDLKPANIMLGSFGEVYVIDWGLAKLLSEPEIQQPVDQQNSPGTAEHDASACSAKPEVNGSRQTARSEFWTDRSAVPTMMGVVVGTPGYMSPEQAAGSSSLVDRRSDVFALGAVLGEILAGTTPDAGEFRERLDQVAAHRELADLAFACLSAEPDQRPPDAEHVLRRVQTWRRGVQERLRASELDRARQEERRRRRRIVLALATGLLLVLGSSAAGAVWVARRETVRVQELAQQRQEQEQRRQEEAQRRQAVNRELRKTLSVADKLYASGPVDWRTDPLRRTRILESARRAETLVETGLAEPADIQRLEALRHRIETDDADARLLGRLDQIRLERNELPPQGNRSIGFQTGPMCRKAFSIYGLEIPETDPQAAVEKLRSRPARVAEACVLPLECWRLLLPPNAPESPWIDTVLEQIDDNAWRRKTRQACQDKDWLEVQRLLEMSGRKQLAVDTVNLVAMRLIREEQFELARQLLRPAQTHHPGDFWINHYLGISLSHPPDPELAESLRYFTAALAIRESAEAYQNLATTLVQLQRYSDAENAYRSAARLEPEWVLPHLDLAHLFTRQDRLEEAGHCLQRVLQLDPGNKQARQGLAQGRQAAP